MQITVEISYYPLDNDYGNKVLDFILVLKDQPDITLRTNAMSTQVKGDIDAVMSAVTNAMKRCWSSGVKAPLVMKCFNDHLDLEWLST